MNERRGKMQEKNNTAAVTGHASKIIEHPNLKCYPKSMK